MYAFDQKVNFTSFNFQELLSVPIQTLTLFVKTKNELTDLLEISHLAYRVDKVLSWLKETKYLEEELEIVGSKLIYHSNLVLNFCQINKSVSRELFESGLMKMGSEKSELESLLVSRIRFLVLDEKCNRDETKFEKNWDDLILDLKGKSNLHDMNREESVLDEEKRGQYAHYPVLKPNEQESSQSSFKFNFLTQKYFSSSTQDSTKNQNLSVNNSCHSEILDKKSDLKEKQMENFLEVHSQLSWGGNSRSRNNSPTINPCSDTRDESVQTGIRNDILEVEKEKENLNLSGYDVNKFKAINQDDSISTTRDSELSKSTTMS
ncbi:hypothetical protein HK099_006057 [Clydaea vesicula]|uniref:Uncharacterized protein n=1 Tax=Clydaea vesicula TaxID=447962 RepID=A0AAD5Y3R6_9FUNG|nr:hypothetical protein HK099_006057 [Clydaea vesicula]